MGIVIFHGKLGRDNLLLNYVYNTAFVKMWSFNLPNNTNNTQLYKPILKSGVSVHNMQYSLNM